MPSTWISVLLAMLLTASALWLRHTKQTASRAIDHFITFILVWKFSVFVTDTQSVIQQPLSLIYFNGGLVGVVMASLTVVVITWRDHKKLQLPLLEIVGYLFGFYSLAMVILNENTGATELITLSSAIVVLVMTWSASRIKRTLYVAMLVTIVFATSFLQPLGVSNVFLWWTLTMLVVSYGLMTWNNRKEFIHD